VGRNILKGKRRKKVREKSRYLRETKGEGGEGGGYLKQGKKKSGFRFERRRRVKKRGKTKPWGL